MPAIIERTCAGVALALLLGQIAFAAQSLAQSLAAQSLAAQAPADPPPIVLQPIPHFPSEAAAHAACPRDAVVWADQDNGYFYPKVLPQFGHTAHGTFSCLKVARGAGYWDANPFSEPPEKGKEFPIDPALLPSGV